jgi:regulator of RNase E activity RraA
LGDGDGVVVVPKDWLDNALKEAHLASEKEAKRLAAIKKGDVYPSWLIPTLREKGVLGSEEDL